MSEAGSEIYSLLVPLATGRLLVPRHSRARKAQGLFGLKLRWLRAHPDDLLTEVRAP